MIDVQLVPHDIPWEELSQTTAASEHGADILFLGRVRNHNEGRAVTAVSYDAFPVLTLDVFKKICIEAQTQFGEDMNFRLWHRTGRLEIGGLSVFIQVTSRHRDACYQASRYVIEELKKRAPIWKKEHYVEGDSEWLKGTSLTSSV